jgi:hypothetical protein
MTFLIIQELNIKIFLRKQDRNQMFKQPMSIKSGITRNCFWIWNIGDDIDTTEIITTNFKMLWSDIMSHLPVMKEPIGLEMLYHLLDEEVSDAHDDTGSIVNTTGIHDDTENTAGVNPLR